MTIITARNVRGGITEDSFTDLTTVPVSSIEPGQSITVTFDGVLTDGVVCSHPPHRDRRCRRRVDARGGRGDDVRSRPHRLAAAH